MPKISIQPDCGNAPRKLFLKDLNVALANGDMDFICNIIPETVNWEIIGETKVTGRQDYLQAILKHKLWKVKELTIDTIITHGPDAAVKGSVRTSDNLKFAFCNIYNFKGAGGTIIKSISTFLIKE
jgi:hypothetical protein